MTMPDKQPYRPHINRARHTRHWPIIVALGISLLLHGVLFLDLQPEAQLSNKTVINAKLLRKQPEGNAVKEEKPQTEQIARQPIQEATQQQANKAAPPAVQTTSEDNKPIDPVVKQTSIPDTVLNSSSDKTQNQPKEQPTDSVIGSVKQQHHDQQKPQNQQQAVLQKKGLEEEYSDPIERSYAQQILAHLDQHLIAPQHLRGQVRLSLTIRYGQIATQVEVIKSSGSAEVDDWVLKAVLAANPFPAAPAELTSPFIFRPTIDLSAAE